MSPANYQSKIVKEDLKCIDTWDDFNLNNPAKIAQKIKKKTISKLCTEPLLYGALGFLLTVFNANLSPSRISPMMELLIPDNIRNSFFALEGCPRSQCMSHMTPEKINVELDKPLGPLQYTILLQLHS